MLPDEFWKSEPCAQRVEHPWGCSLGTSSDGDQFLAHSSRPASRGCHVYSEEARRHSQLLVYEAATTGTADFTRVPFIAPCCRTKHVVNRWPHPYKTPGKRASRKVTAICCMAASDSAEITWHPENEVI